MSAIQLSPGDLAIAASLVVLDGVLSLVFRLELHRQIAVGAVRLVVQLIAVGYVLRFVFALHNPAATLAIAALMMLVAAREVAARPERRLRGRGNLLIGSLAVVLATTATAVLALTTAIRPQPWYDPRYAIPLTGIILGNVLNAGAITLDGVLSGFPRERTAIEARLALGETFVGGDAADRRRRDPPRDGAADQPDVGRRHRHVAGHHDRPDPRRHGSARCGEIPDPADVPARRRRRVGVGGHRVARRAPLHRCPPAPAARQAGLILPRETGEGDHPKGGGGGLPPLNFRIGHKAK